MLLDEFSAHDLQSEITYFSKVMFTLTCLALLATGHPILFGIEFCFLYGLMGEEEEESFEDDDDDEFEVFEDDEDWEEDMWELSLAEWAGTEILPLDMDNVLDLIAEEPVVFPTNQVIDFYSENWREAIRYFSVIQNSCYKLDYNELDSLGYGYLYADDDKFYKLMCLSRESMRQTFYNFMDVETESRSMVKFASHRWKYDKFDWSPFKGKKVNQTFRRHYKAKRKEFNKAQFRREVENVFLLQTVLSMGIHYTSIYDFEQFHRAEYIEEMKRWERLREIEYICALEEYKQYWEEVKEAYGDYYLPEDPSIYMDNTQTAIVDPKVRLKRREILETVVNRWRRQYSPYSLPTPHINVPSAYEKLPYYYYVNYGTSYLNVSSMEYLYIFTQWSLADKYDVKSYPKFIT